jgi:hypothetical protein
MSKSSRFKVAAAIALLGGTALNATIPITHPETQETTGIVIDFLQHHGAFNSLVLLAIGFFSLWIMVYLGGAWFNWVRKSTNERFWKVARDVDMETRGDEGEKLQKETNTTPQFLSERAFAFVETTRTAVGIIAGKLGREYPKLFNNDGHHRFILYGTIAGAWLGCVRLYLDVPREHWEILEGKVQSSLEAWHSDTQRAFRQVDEFVSEVLVTVEGEGGEELLCEQASLWAVRSSFINLAKSHQQKISKILADGLWRETCGYWKPVAREDAETISGAAGGMRPQSQEDGQE